MSNSSRRVASHAGTWYSGDGKVLAKEMTGWLDKVQLDNDTSPARAIIGPHAGYHYSGSTAAYAYKQINPEGIKRVFILGPAHRMKLSGCLVSSCSVYETPLYDLTVDKDVNKELLGSKGFDVVSLKAEEDEHSIELHLPYIAKMMEPKQGEFTIVPILVGSLSPDKEYKYGKILAKYLMDPSNLFVISTDFCHWGNRFNYTYYDQKAGEIHESISNLDHKGMKIIESMDHDAFAAYLKKYSNTICGRHPVGIFLGMVKAIRQHSEASTMELKFLKYAQSENCRKTTDSSVSYASASFVMS
ncbi:protein MEMO1 [Lepeophtheirus salmonis]|uniref:Protein MEMO1 n=1 Tax=Lepeophtheirus salmonis TaxID=72036 RepID=A0A0K2UFS2_LEPSM|nr:protein MEMO1-like [Lepeophtheirus salmonis]